MFSVWSDKREPRKSKRATTKEKRRESSESNGARDSNPVARGTDTKKTNKNQQKQTNIYEWIWNKRNTTKKKTKERLGDDRHLSDARCPLSKPKRSSSKASSFFFFLNSVSIFSLLVLFRCSYFYVVFFFRLCARLFALLPAFVVTGFNGFFFDFPWFKMSEKKSFAPLEWFRLVVNLVLLSLTGF